MKFNFAKWFGTTIFRFSCVGPHFLSEIKNKELYFSQPSDFNDPFDCQLEYRRALRSALSHYLAAVPVDIDSFANNVDYHIASARVCCFSSARKNQLMWAHYAAKHTGICIGFDTARIARETGCQMEKVWYMAKHPLNSKNSIRGITSDLELREALDLPNDHRAIFKAVADRLLCSKYSYWRYEREVRLISLGEQRKAISPKAITSVTLGLKATSPVRRDLYDALNSSDWCHVKLFQAEKKPEEYALQFSEITRESLLNANPHHP